MTDADFDRDLNRMADQVDQVSAQAQEQLARIGAMQGNAETADGAIRVRVKPGGLLSEVQITEAALRSGSEVVAAQILTLANRATRRVGERMYHALAPVLGPAGEPHLRSLGYEPIPEDDEDALPVRGFERR